MIAVRNGQGTFFQQTVCDSQHVDTEYIEYCLQIASRFLFYKSAVYEPNVSMRSWLKVSKQ